MIYRYSLKVLSAHESSKDGSLASRLIHVRQQMESMGIPCVTTTLKACYREKHRSILWQVN